MEIGVHILEWILKTGQALPEVLFTLPMPVLLGILALPLFVATFSRSGLGIAGTGILTVATLVLLARETGQGDGSGLALLVYAGALIVALNGFEATDRRRNLAAQIEEIEQLRKDMRAFLDALDRRAQIVDMVAAKGAEMKVTGEGTSEGAEQVN
jgi:hypothetical protein